MSVYLYDKALVQKLKGITESTNIHVYSPDDTESLFNIIADESGDKPIQLPIICLHRSQEYTIKELGNNPRSKDALVIKSVLNDNGNPVSSQKMNVIPISVGYTIDVYTRKFEQADSIVRELIFILTNSPNVDVVIPYMGLNFVHRSALELGTSVRDNSSIPERLIPGQFTRLTLDCSIPDAYLFDVRTLPNVSSIETGGLKIMSPGGYVMERLET